MLTLNGIFRRELFVTENMHNKDKTSDVPSKSFELLQKYGFRPGIVDALGANISVSSLHRKGMATGLTAAPPSIYPTKMANKCLNGISFFHSDGT